LTVSQSHFLPEFEDNHPAENVDQSKQKGNQTDEVSPGAHVIFFSISEKKIVISNNFLNFIA